MSMEALANAVIDRAESLLAAVQCDEPAIHVLDMAATDGTGGLSHGSGHHVAQAHGLAGCAVMVRVAPFLAEFLADIPARHLAHVRPALVAMPIEFLAAHEAGHAIVSPLDPSELDATEAERLRGLATADTVTLRDRAESHHPAWAAAVAILYARGMALRPDHATQWRKLAVAEFEGYGFDFATVAALVADVPAGASIRQLVADADWLDRITAACPTIEERRRLMAERNNVPGVPARELAAVAA